MTDCFGKGFYDLFYKYFIRSSVSQTTKDKNVFKNVNIKEATGGKPWPQNRSNTILNVFWQLRKNIIKDF